jgi:MoaA/NifB/PqqE/SkfB family radical SAM enzyme
MERPQKVMEMETFKKIVDKSILAGVRRFDLTPVVGDPFADQHIFERFQYLAKVGATKVGFTTNAIAFSPRKIDKLFEFQNENPNLRIGFTVSLGGFDKETYLEIFKVDRFDAVSNNLLYLLKASEYKGNTFGKINILARCPPARFYGDFFDTIISFKERGI